MTTPVVEFQDVTKRFGDVTALNGVSFDLVSGQILSLLGPSGCGKTTVLRLIAGFESPNQGAVLLRGETVASGTIHVPPERRRVGMLFQEYALFPHLTVAQNVAFGLHRLPSGEKHSKLRRAVELVRLEGLEGRYPHELSGGQQQRVALARTLAPQPVVVLLDEPFSNVDASLRAQMRSEVEAILRDGQFPRSSSRTIGRRRSPPPIRWRSFMKAASSRSILPRPFITRPRALTWRESVAPQTSSTASSRTSGPPLRSAASSGRALKKGSRKAPAFQSSLTPTTFEFSTVPVAPRPSNRASSAATRLSSGFSCRPAMSFAPATYHPAVWLPVPRSASRPHPEPLSPPSLGTADSGPLPAGGTAWATCPLDKRPFPGLTSAAAHRSASACQDCNLH